MLGTRLHWLALGMGFTVALWAVGSAYGGLIDNFDPPNSNVTATQSGSAPGPQVLSGGPSGQYLRLINDGVNNQRNHYSYDRTDTGWYSTIVAQFDFAGYSADQAADGFSFSFLPTSLYGTSGAGPVLSESANAPGVFGIGFWVYPSGTNHLSVHWDNREIVRYYVDPAKVNFATGTWNQAKLTVNSIGPGGNVKLELIGDVNGTPQTVTVFDKYFYGPSGFENRVQFSGRTGGADMDVNLDNIQVSYSNPIASPPGTVSPPSNTLMQDFDNLGTTHFVANQYSSAPGPQVLPPSGSERPSNYLRLIQQTNSQANQIAFDRVAQGFYQRIEAEWDFSILDGADGGAFALLNTGWEGITGPVSNPSPAWEEPWEEPRFPNGFAIGFDVWQNIHDISLNWDGQQVVEVSSYDYRGSTFKHASAVIEFVSGGANVSLSIDSTPIFTNYFIAGMTPYESRVAFGARTGWVNTNFDLDNITVRWLNPIAQPTDPFHWRGITGDYTDNTKWTNNILPGPNDAAVIDVGVATGSVALQHSASGSLTVTGYGGINASSIQVASAAGSQGTLILSGNAQVRSSGDFYVANGAGAVGNVSIADSARLIVAGLNTVVGRGGQGHFLQNGGSVNLRRLYISEFTGSAGSTYTMNNGTLTLNDVMEVGRTETGSFIQNGGSVTASSNLYIANRQGGGGAPGGSTYQMNAGSLTVNGAHLVVGRGDDGHFVQNGGTVTLNRLFLSEFEGSAGSTYTMNNGTLSLNQRMEVGRSELGTFTQTGGVVNALAVEASPDDFSIMIGRYGPGVYNLQGGTLNVGVLRKGADGQFNFTGGRLNAQQVGFALSNDGGVLAPADTAIGTTTILGDYTQTSAGTLEIDIESLSSFDTLSVQGNATLAGQVLVDLWGTYSPGLGEGFNILSATGTIDITGLSVTGDPPVNTRWLLNVLDAPGGGQILQLQAALPEPSSFVLGLVGLLALAGFRILTQKASRSS